jgi:hypothetical protein
MTTPDAPTVKQSLTCLSVLFHLFVIPMWFVLLFYILHTIGAPAWVWACYWAYCPLTMIAGVLKHLSD